MIRLLLLAAALAACGRSRTTPPPEVILVDATLPGASAFEVETQLTVPLERALAATPGLTSIRSESRAGFVELQLAFPAATDRLAALGGLRAAIEPALRQLPPEASAPSLRTAPSAQPPVRFVLRDAARTAVELRSLASSAVRVALETLAGTAGVTLCGGAEREIQIELDDGRLASLGLGSHAVTVALAGEAVRTVEELAGVVIDSRGGVAVRLRDVAVVRDGAARPACLALVGGMPALVGEVQLQRGAGADVRAAIAARLRELAATLPPGASLEALAPLRAGMELTLAPGARPEQTLDVAARIGRTLGSASLIRWEALRPERLEVWSTSMGADEIAQAAAAVPGVRARVLAGAAAEEQEILIVGDELDALRRAADDVVAVLRATPEIAAAGVAEGEQAPQMRVNLDRARLADLGVAASEARDVLALARDGLRGGRIGDAPVVLRLPPSGEPLPAATVQGSGGARVPLAEIARIEQILEPASILRVNQRRAVTVWFRPAGPLDNSARDALRRRLAAVSLPVGVAVAAPQPTP